MTGLRSSLASIWLCSLALAAPALAGDGVLEINQTCALSAAGCFPGDVGGSFPVTIAQSGTSYRLTSSLQVPNENTTAIHVTPFDASVSIDLNGFSIRGVTACSAGGGQPAVCSPRGSGVGISALGNVRVHNGFVTRMGSHGIDISSGRVEDVVAFMNGGDGIRASEAVSVHAVEAIWNHQNGIYIAISGVVTACAANGNGGTGILVIRGSVTDCVSDRNGELGFNTGGQVSLRGNVFAENDLGSLLGAGLATGGNYCDDGRCTRTGAKRYYLSQNTANGAQAATACSLGFHMASVWEILDPSGFEYDTTLGVVVANSGSGPPSATPTSLAYGWIREGLAATTGANCNAWTSASAGHSGNAVYLDAPGSLTSLPNTVTGASPWRKTASSTTCDLALPVWCVED